MLEEIAMEKKSSIRSGQGPSKGNCSESKKVLDATNGKPFARNARKREPPNINGPKQDQVRKPLPQKKGKFPDNRPKPRGGVSYGRGRNENCQITDEEFEAEFGFIFEPGGKKQSLSHLCNFHYAPRGDNKPKNDPQTTWSTRSLMATQAHKYNKEQFLQANCQFVVREGGDYSFNLGDPDLLVDWDHVELIVTSSSDKVICPICLYPPVAAKITRCGHVFCWSCVLHYLALSDKSWRKCPICYESIHKKDLKSVECIEKDLYSVGMKIIMRLMKREKGTLVATPVNQFNARTKKPILGYGQTEIDTVYSKLLTASQTDVTNIISREYQELQMQVEEFKGCPELCFVEQALDLLAERKSFVTSMFNKTQETTAAGSTNFASQLGTLSETSCDTNDLPFLLDSKDSDIVNGDINSKLCGQRSESESAGSEGDETNINAEDLEIKTLTASQKHYYFYQAADGQHVYLHSLNVRMLENTYGSLENCPVEISGKIVEKETGSMTQQLRKRLRYLQHVPITCQFEVIELELSPPIVSEEVLEAYRDQIEERHRRRLRQARAEKRREKKIEEAEMKHFSRHPAPNLLLESHYHFPEFGLEEHRSSSGEMQKLEPAASSEHSIESISPNRDKSPLSSAVAALSLDSEEMGVVSGPSFAQMLRGGKTITNDVWPMIGGGNKGNNAASSNVWGRRVRQISVTQESADSDNDSAFSPPAKPSFNIAEAIELAASIERGESSGGRKKKKKPQKILFSTGTPKGT